MTDEQIKDALELKECPFCGSAAIEYKCEIDLLMKGSTSVKCSNRGCGAKATSPRHWNSRVTRPQPQQMVGDVAEGTVMNVWNVNAYEPAAIIKRYTDERGRELADVRFLKTNISKGHFTDCMAAFTALQAAKLPQKVDVAEILESNSWDLRCVNIPTGGDDYDIGWRVIEHHMAEPCERIIGYGTTPLEALKDAENSDHLTASGYSIVKDGGG